MASVGLGNAGADQPPLLSPILPDIQEGNVSGGSGEPLEKLEEEHQLLGMSAVNSNGKVDIANKVEEDARPATNSSSSSA